MKTQYKSMMVGFFLVMATQGCAEIILPEGVMRENERSETAPAIGGAGGVSPNGDTGGLGFTGGIGGSGGASSGGGDAGNDGSAGEGGNAPSCVPSMEQCDKQDNNCDGIVDEGCQCSDGETQPCYGGPPDTKLVGVCKAGLQTCSGGAWAACEGHVIPTIETCNNLDDDCDGAIDENISGLGGPCGVQGQLGECANGKIACAAGMITCAQIVYPASAETCNNKDDDCDGQIDEGVQTHYCYDGDGDQFGNPSNATDACVQPTGYVTNCSDCDDTNNTANPGHVEVCGDFVDNDCNGTATCECTPSEKRSRWICTEPDPNCAISPRPKGIKTIAIQPPLPCCLNSEYCTETCLSSGQWSGCDAIP